MVEVTPTLAFRGRHATVILFPKETDSITPGHDLLLPSSPLELEATELERTSAEDVGRNPIWVAGTETFGLPTSY